MTEDDDEVVKTPEQTLATIDLKEWIAIQTVVNAAREWAQFQNADSQLAQKKKPKLGTRAFEAAINLRAAVLALERLK